MDNKIQNIILKAIIFIFIGTGVFMTYNVMNDDNPYGMQPEEHREWGKKAYNEEGENLTPGEANVWITKKTEEIVEEKKEILDSHVSNVIDYTRFLVIFSVVLVLGSFVYLITIDYKKALKILAGMTALVLFLYISYAIASDAVPACIGIMDGDVAECKKIYTPSNWKIASAAISTTLVLIIITILAWVSGPVMKLFR
jgi:uncharacterized membrane protein